MRSTLGHPVAGDGAFKTTRWSLVLASANPDGAQFRAALSELAEGYRTAIQAYIRTYFKCDADHADEITQAFLTTWVERGMKGVDPDRGRFRSYLRGALRHFVQNRRRSEQAVKRGGQADVLRLDGGSGRIEIADRECQTPDAAFDATYRRELLSRAVDLMAAEYDAEDRAHYLRAFRMYYLDPPDSASPPTYRDLADQLGTSTTQIINWLAHARARLRKNVTALVRESVTDERGFRTEMALLRGESDEGGR